MEKFLYGVLVWLIAIGNGLAQPIVHLSEHGEPVELACAVQLDDSASYQWYRNSSNSNVSGVAIVGANSRLYVTNSFSNKEIRFYYCVATSSYGESESSDVSIVAYTGLPTVKINTLNGEEPSAEYAYAADGSYGRTITNVTKVPASMQIIDSSGNLVYESGEYKHKNSGLTIKLRGNTSVDLAGKSSYKLKLQKKADLLASLNSRSGESFQDKEWILHKTATTFDPVIGFAVCDIVGVPWTPKYAFVNVVLNNEYFGFYMLMEAIDRNESRIDVSESGYIIERDAYWWNEKVKFITPVYNQKYTFKYPDDDDISEEQLSYIEGYVNTLEQHIGDGSYGDYIDVESFARWLLVHDFLGSWDVAGSNVFMSKYDASENSKLRMLTNWDFDSNFMQEGKWSVQHYGDRAYVAWLFRNSNRVFANTYKSLYDSLASSVWESLEKKLNELNNALGKQIDLSRYCDSVRWQSRWRSPVAYDLYVAKKWFVSREPWLKNAIENTHAISYELNGGRFEKKSVVPDTISFLGSVEIPNPKRSGYVFSGWTSEYETIPVKNMVLYGYNVIDGVLLTANWIPDIHPIKKFDEDMSLNEVDFERPKRFSVEIFSVIGKFMGHVMVDVVDVIHVLKSLRDAGYANGVYILRSDALRKNFRIRLE